MFKKLVILLLFASLLIFPKVLSAQSDFIIDATVTYNIQEEGTTIVTHEITLTNNLSNLYATSYTMGLEGLQPENIRVYKGNSERKLNINTDGDSTSMEVLFDSPAVGKGNFQKFTISFEEGSFATKSGEVWEISIPRLSSPENFRTYKVNLLVPQSFGQRAFISPEPINKTQTADKYSYVFEKNSIAVSGISAGFGEFQVFSFSLSYHLENPLNRAAYTEIAIPPDTAFQKVYFQSIDPVPEKVYIDADGNWLAVYKLKARERMDISAIGSVQIFAQPRQFPEPDEAVLEENKKETEFWQSSDPNIKQLAQIYSTPRQIYDFVTNSLTYNYDRVRPNVQRMGAKEALINPNAAICLEFTDLFVAITRAAGIPAREVNGYAYSENPVLQPLSLVADVLHAWPEYWDSEKKVWVPVDPTWGSTTGGVDYFTKLDLRHFTFVIHGANPNQPYPPGSYKLGPNPQKDVFVNFGQLPQTLSSTPEITAETISLFPISNMKLSVKIYNPGPSALYDLNPKILFDKSEVLSQEIEILPPFSNYELESTIPFSFLGKKTPQQVEIVVAGEKLVVPGFKTQVVIYNLVGLFIILLLIATFIFLKIKRLNIFKIVNLIKSARIKKAQNETKKSEIHKG